MVTQNDQVGAQFFSPRGDGLRQRIGRRGEVVLRE